MWSELRVNNYNIEDDVDDTSTKVLYGIEKEHHRNKEFSIWNSTRNARFSHYKILKKVTKRSSWTMIFNRFHFTIEIPLQFPDFFKVP